MDIACFRNRYVVFYLPFDFGYKVLRFAPIRLACEVLREVYRLVGATKSGFTFEKTPSPASLIDSFDWSFFPHL